MRRILLAALLAAGCHSHADAPRVYITLGADVLPAAEGLGASSVEQDGDVALVAIDEAQLPALALAIHDQFGRCGGFELHDSLATAEHELHAKAPPLTKIDYSIDRGALVQPVLTQLSAERIRDVIAKLSSLKTRYYLSDSGAEASHMVAALWQGYARAAGRDDVKVELVDQGWPQKTVVMTIPGTTRASEVVLIGGHIDSIVMRGTKDSVAPGADDDASGIATESEVARTFLASGARPERTLQFAAYAAEEVGLRGSQKLVADYKARGVNVVGALQLDMTNYQGSEKDIYIMKDFSSAPQNEFLGKLIDAYVGASWGTTACGYACSDHASWYRAGVPASMPFEGQMSDGNKRIHTAKDTLAASNDNASHALKFARLATAYAIELTKADPAGGTFEE